MKYFKLRRATITLLICLSIVTIMAILMHNLLGFMLGGVCIYLLLRSASYERIVELAEIEEERLKKIIHILQMRSKNQN